MSTTCLIIGANSAIASAFARRLASQGQRLILVSRDADKLAQQQADLLVRGASEVHVVAMDVGDFIDENNQLGAIINQQTSLDSVLIAHGTLPDQENCQHSIEAMNDAVVVNGLSTLRLMTFLLTHFEQQGAGVMAVITSVAGDRGRQSNYVYGAAKALVSTFIEGAQHRFAGSNVKIIDIKPGFVDTPMTAHLPKGALWAQPDAVAQCISKAMDKGTPVAYAPGFWRFIMLIIKYVPRFVMHKTKL